MTPTLEQIQYTLDCFKKFLDYCDGKNLPLALKGLKCDNQSEAIISVLKSALEDQPVDIEALKREYILSGESISVEKKAYTDGWNACIDHLAATGRLAGVNMNQKYGWKCNNCNHIFTDKQEKRTDDGLGNGGAKCSFCKADGQYTYRYELHQGDPCIKCNTPHDLVNIGECKKPDQDVREALDALERIKGPYKNDPLWENEYEKIRKALMRPAVPECYALVPIEPTDKMINAALDCHYYKRNSFQAIYKAMLAAAPKQGD